MWRCDGDGACSETIPIHVSLANLLCAWNNGTEVPMSVCNVVMRKSGVREDIHTPLDGSCTSRLAMLYFMDTCDSLPFVSLCVS